MKITENSLSFAADTSSIFSPSLYHGKGHFARLTRWGRKSTDFLLCRCVINSRANVFSLSGWGGNLNRSAKEAKRKYEEN
jgi:hypothetical protein